MFRGEKGCRGYNGVFGALMGCFEVFGGERGFWGRKRCRRHTGVFVVQMRCFGHGVKGVFGGRKGVFEAEKCVWGCNGKCSGGTLLVPGVPFQE